MSDIPMRDLNTGKTIRRVGLAGAGGCLGTGLLIVACVAALLFGISYLMKSNDVYRLAVETAQSDPQVIAALGEPVEAGWFVLGSIETSGLSGQADLRIPISGPKDKGTLFAGARRENGVWVFYTLAVEVRSTGEVIALGE